MLRGGSTANRNLYKEDSSVNSHEFTRIYFEVYFHDEYQKKSLAIDPVMNVRFPQAFAAGKKEYPKRTYHFYTDESLRLFEHDPSAYIDVPSP